MLGADARVAHISQRELHRAACVLAVRVDRVDGPAVAALVGEAPGPRSNPSMPLFPHPRTGAGGRLLDYAEITAAQYLGRFVRRNLFYRAPARWSAPEARRRATQLLPRLAELGAQRVVLLGRRVALAFGVDSFWQSWRVIGLEVTAIPHPSGRNRVYNEAWARKFAGAAVRWAAGYPVDAR